jgi:hypothetical protein
VTTPSSRTHTTSLHMDDSPTLDIPYGETSRQYRRTVYTHEDWVRREKESNHGFFFVFRRLTTSVAQHRSNIVRPIDSCAISPVSPHRAFTR